MPETIRKQQLRVRRDAIGPQTAFVLEGVSSTGRRYGVRHVLSHDELMTCRDPKGLVVAVVSLMEAKLEHYAATQ